MSPPSKKKTLFLEQVGDRYIRENFRRVEYLLKELETSTVTGSIGPQGPQGPAGDPGLTQATDTGTSGGGSITGGSISLAQNRAVKYTILAYNALENVTSYQEFVVLNIDDTTAGLKSSTGFKFGTPLNFTITPAITAGNIELTITNNELYDLSIEITQVLLGNL